MTVPVRIPLPGGGALDGALALPERRSPTSDIASAFPGVVVLHELFGLNDDIRRIADRFASEGYAAVVPDLYSHGNRALCLSRVLAAGASGAAMTATLADIEAARSFLAGHDAVDGDRLAVAGFCLGGGFALLAGARGGLRASAVHYGSVPKDRAAIEDTCPVVASYGRLDRSFLPHAERLEQHLAAIGVPSDVRVYDGVGHSFLSYDNGPSWLARLPSPLHPGYAETEAEHAWARLLTFFGEHVRDA